MPRLFQICALSALCAGFTACGNQDAPAQRPPAEIPAAPEAPKGGTCTEPLKKCPGDAVPTVSDAPECKQLCPGE